MTQGASSPRERGGGDRRPRGTSWLTAFAAVLAASASTAGVAYQLWPEHHFSAALEVTGVTPSVNEGEYLQHVHVGPGTCRDSVKRRGAMFYLRARIEGVDRSTLSLSATLYAANRSLQHVTDWDQSMALAFPPGRSINQEVGRAWVPVPLPKARNRYFVRFELTSGKAGALIAYADSPVFGIQPSSNKYAGPACELPSDAAAG